MSRPALWSYRGLARTLRREKATQLPEHEARVFEDVAEGKAPELVAARTGLALTAAVLLPCVARVVKPVAVELDCQALLRPAAIHPPATGSPVGLGQRKSRVLQQCQEGALE